MDESLRVRPGRLVAVVLAVGLVLAGCGSGAGGDAAPSSGTVPVPADEPSAAATATATAPAATLPDGVSLVATAGTPSIDVFDDPGDPAPARTLDAADVVSVPDEIPMTFLAVEGAEPTDGWVHVHLPVRPNGSTGWVRADDVTLTTTDLHVEVRLAEHRMLVHRGGEVVMDVPVGVGREDVPTPGGVYYVKELLQPPDPDGPYGAYAYGLSGFSPVLEQFAGGEGVIGIHGTDDPDSVGTDASHGCLRLHDDDIRRLVEDVGLPLGTPVEVLP